MKVANLIKDNIKLGWLIVQRLVHYHGRTWRHGGIVLEKELYILFRRRQKEIMCHVVHSLSI